MAGASADRRRVWLWAFVPLAIIVFLACVLAVIAVLVFFDDPFGLGGSGNGHFPNALVWAEPDPWHGNTFVGYAGASAEKLTRIGQGHEFNRDLRFVDAVTSSTGHFVVSVNPIDKFTWAGTALSSNGRCYALLSANDPGNPENGRTYYAEFPAGTPCRASEATRGSVRRTTEPE